jgi:hypothetical protein
MRNNLRVLGLPLALIVSGALAHAQSTPQDLPNLNQQITPLAPQGSRFEPMNPGLLDLPNWLAGQAVTTVVSPDHRTLLVLTSGFNRVYYTGGADIGKINPSDSAEYVFLYDISTPTPVKKQVLKIPNTYNGMIFDPSGTAFYVSGGVDDKVYVFTLGATGIWGAAPRIRRFCWATPRALALPCRPPANRYR